MAGRFGRWLATIVLLAGMASVRAQEPPDEAPKMVAARQMAFPFSIDPLDQPQILNLELYVSTDRGRSWRLYTMAAPDKGKLEFEAAGDGEYWFATRRVFKDGRFDPPTLNKLQVARRILVDTTAPRLTLTPLYGGGEIGFAWEISGADADLGTLRADMTSPDAPNPTPVQIRESTRGEKRWRPEGSGPFTIRVTVADKAGNRADQSVTISPTLGPIKPSGQAGQTNSPGFGGSNRTPAVGSSNSGDSGDFPVPGRPQALRDGMGQSRPSDVAASTQNNERRGRLVRPDSFEASQPDQPSSSRPKQSKVKIEYVNRLKFNLYFKLENAGRSGVKAVSLFYRYPDQREWEKYDANAPKDSPFFPVSVSAEGTYGVTLRATSGVGLGEDPPQPGDEPQIWVVVDSTPPQIQLEQPEVKHGAAPSVRFRWKVTDEHPGTKKTRLFYSSAENQTPGEWKEITAGLENEGSYVWTPPPNAPYRFNVRIESEDAASNSAREETAEPVVVDNSRPRVLALRAEAVKDGVEPTTKPANTDSPAPLAPRGNTEDPPSKPRDDKPNFSAIGGDDPNGDLPPPKKLPQSGASSSKPKDLPKPFGKQ